MALLFENLPETKPRRGDAKLGVYFVDSRLTPDSSQDALCGTYIGQASVASDTIKTCRKCVFWARSLKLKLNRHNGELKPEKHEFKYFGYIKNNGGLRRGYCHYPIKKIKKLYPHSAKACSLFSAHEEGREPPAKNPSLRGRTK